MRISKSHLCVVLAATAALFAADSGYNLFQKGLAKERAEADLRGAVRIYEQVVRENAKDHKLAAQALFRIGECQQALGNMEARKIYERLMRDYPDQNEIVSLAQARLTAMRSAPASGSSIITRQIWTGQQVAIYASVSPNGRYLSFVDQQTGNLALHDLDTGKDRNLTSKGTWSDSDEYAEESVFAPDGNRVAYAWFNKDRRYDLRLVGLESSGARTPRVLYTNEDIAWIAPKDWSANGKWIAVRLERKDGSVQIGLVDAADGSLRVLKSVDWSSSGKMFFTPDGQYLAFDSSASDGSQTRDIFVLAVDGSREIPAVTHAADDAVVGWTPDGKHLLFASDRTGSIGIYSLAFEDGRFRGAPRQIKSDIGDAHTIAMTRSGTLFFALTPGSRDFYTATINFESGQAVGPPIAATQQFLGSNYGPDWSRDGKFLSYQSYRFRQTNVLEILTAKTGQTRELRPRLRYFNSARWSPDGTSFVAGGADFKGRQGIYRINAQSGVVDPVVLSAPGEESQIPQWAPDGKRIYYRNQDSILERDLDSGTEREVLRESHLGWFSLSPDGRSLVCTVGGAASKEASISIITVAGDARRDLILPSGGFSRPEWTPDGRQILLLKSGSLWAVAASGGQPRKIDPGVGRVLYVRIHPDGRQIAFLTRNDTPQEVWVMENLLPVLNASK